MKKKWWIVIGIVVVAGAVVAWFATRGPEVTKADEEQADKSEEEVDETLGEDPAAAAKAKEEEAKRMLKALENEDSPADSNEAVTDSVSTE